MGISENIKKLRQIFDITQKELSEVAGVTENAVSKWENDYAEPRMGAIEKIAARYGLKKSNIIEDGGMDNIDPITKKDTSTHKIGFVNVPLYGSIAAGTPIEMLEIEDEIQSPEPVFRKHPNGFYLRVEGESMNRILPNGSLALIDPCSTIDYDMQPYAICVNGNEATIKRVKKLAYGFVLVPDSTDPTYRQQTYDYNEPGTETITVIGRVVYYMLPFDWSF